MIETVQRMHELADYMELDVKRKSTTYHMATKRKLVLCKVYCTSLN